VSTNGSNSKTGNVLYVQPNIGARSCNQSYSQKAVIITYFECLFVALGIQHAMCMYHIEICDLPVLRKFCTLSHTQHDFRKKVTE